MKTVFDSSRERFDLDQQRRANKAVIQRTTIADDEFRSNYNLAGGGHMSAVERLDDQDARIALPGNAAIPAIAVPKNLRGERLRPLVALGPYLARYRAKTSAALVALTVASLATLVVPVAVRRMIDFGFTAESVNMINSYFSLMIVVVAVLALASASRVYLVTTLGERIVADLRRDVFSHLTLLSPAFFDSTLRCKRAGEHPVWTAPRQRCRGRTRGGPRPRQRIHRSAAAGG
jgi:ABC transporter transmembrane region